MSIKTRVFCLSFMICFSAFSSEKTRVGPVIESIGPVRRVKTSFAISYYQDQGFMGKIVSIMRATYFRKGSAIRKGFAKGIYEARVTDVLRHNHLDFVDSKARSEYDMLKERFDLQQAEKKAHSKQSGDCSTM